MENAALAEVIRSGGPDTFMPLSLAQQIALEKLQRSRNSSTKSSNQNPTENTPRRSERVRCPSAHQLESQAYAESERAGTRSPSPSGPKSTKSAPKSAPKSTSKPTSKSTKSTKPKNPFGTRGDRPGRIVQPVVDAGAASDDDSPEPLAADESDHSDLEVETQRGGFFHVVHVSRSKAIDLATKHTGRDASSYSTPTLKKLLEEILPLREADSSSPVGFEGQDPPTQQGSAHQSVLGGGQQPPTAGAADDASSQGAGSEPEVAPSPDAREELGEDDMAVDEPALNEPATDEPPVDDLDMDLEFETIELGPGDPVSQQPSLGPHTSHLPKPGSPLHSATKPKTPPRPRPTVFPRTPHPRKSMTVVDDDDNESNTDAINTDEESALAPKRQRLAQPPHQPPAARSSSHVAQRAQPFQLGIYRPSGSHAGSLPLRAAVHRPARASSSITLSKPPPGSDMRTGLAWAVQFAKREARTRATTVPVAGSSRQPEADFDLLAQVLGELHALADAAPPPQSNARGSRGSRGLPPVAEDYTEREAQVAFALGKRPRRVKQPTLADLPGLPGLVASRTIPELVATAFAQGPYAGYGTNDQWATEIFQDVAASVTDEEVDNPSRQLRSLMIRRISVGRGDAADRLRPLTSYHFGFIVAPESIDDIEHNVELAKSLLPDWFHYRDPFKRKDAFENPALKQFLALTLFWSRDSYGVVFHDKFKPAVPIPSIAFTLTLMEHDLREWKTGHFVKAELDARTEAEAYQTHLTGLLAYEKEAPVRFHEFQEKAAKYGLNYVGMSEHLDKPAQRPTRVADIRPDSPATKARAKGKARAMH
ncbi:hypothetical protein FRC12_013610 [Ceratobasidium sp. 428]|nr:hypothetical protein FRC12_013610 [Ceratobasidium sp. 428]